MARALPNASFVAARVSSTVSLAKGCDAVCAFVDDDLGSSVVDALATPGVKLILLRCAGSITLTSSARGREGVGDARARVRSVSDQ